MKVAISIGGSIFCKDDGVDVEYLVAFSKAIVSASRKHQIFIVAGGGKTARKYINAGRALQLSEHELDLLGIEATRLNALVVSLAIDDRAVHPIPLKVEEVDADSHRPVVMGGTEPGHSTDAVSAMLAKHVHADILIIATNVNGVYEKDPAVYPDAKRFDKVTSEELLAIVTHPEHHAGSAGVVDMKAARIIHENSINTMVVDGRNVENIVKAIKGKPVGTLVVRERDVR